MKIFEITKPSKKNPDWKINGGYVNIHDNGFLADRTLVIQDKEGNSVALKNEEIGELFSWFKAKYNL